MGNQLISVIVPIYNVENYLRKCLDSILEQTFHNLEILLVNDVLLMVQDRFVKSM